MATILQPFQLLELNVISAQDLVNVSRKMRTYAVAWINSHRKLSTRVDSDGHANPTWNDKFVFRVDDNFLCGDTSAIMIEIYAYHWFRDIHVGTVRALVGNLIPPINSLQDHLHHHLQLGMRFVALQVRRPSGRPQGILNIGVAILDSSKRSLPLYTLNSSSAVGYRHLMGEERGNKDDAKSGEDQNPLENFWHLKPELRRIKSDSSSMFSSAVGNKLNMQNAKTGSVINNGTETQVQNKNIGEARKDESKASSCITTGKKQNVKKAKAGSLVNGSEFGALARAKYGSEVTDGQPIKTPSRTSSPDVAPLDLNKLNSKFDKLDLKAPSGASKKKMLHVSRSYQNPHWVHHRQRWQQIWERIGVTMWKRQGVRCWGNIAWSWRAAWEGSNPNWRDGGRKCRPLMISAIFQVFLGTRASLIADPREGRPIEELQVS